jgi:hypothetical protein
MHAKGGFQPVMCSLWLAGARLHRGIWLAQIYIMTSEHHVRRKEPFLPPAWHTADESMQQQYNNLLQRIFSDILLCTHQLVRKYDGLLKQPSFGVGTSPQRGQHHEAHA